MILTSAVKCRFCGELFDPTLKRAKKGQFQDRQIEGYRGTSEIPDDMRLSG